MIGGALNRRDVLGQLVVGVEGETAPDPVPCETCGAAVPWSWWAPGRGLTPRWMPPQVRPGPEAPVACAACLGRQEEALLERQVVSRLSAWGVPARYQGYRWSRTEKQRRDETFPAFRERIEALPSPTIGITPGNLAAARAIRDWVPGDRWIYVAGQTGTGKTTFAAAFARALASIPREPRRITLEELRARDPEHAEAVQAGRYALPFVRSGVSSLVFVSEPHLQEEARGYWSRSQRGSDEPDPVDRAIEAEILILDDLGAAEPKPAWVQRIASLLDQRYQKKRPCLVTSNLTAVDLDRVYGPRVASRLEQAAQYFELDLSDWRRFPPNSPTR